MGTPIISVIVPVYNKQKYIRRCLDSLILQTLDSEKYEVILIDNNSADGSFDICTEYTESFAFFRLFKNNIQGVSSTRNIGIEAARGKYLAYVDADDSISETTLKNILEFFEEHEKDVDIITYPLWYDTDRPGEINHFRYRYLFETGIYDVDEFPYICQSTMNVCVKKDIFPKLIFNDDMTVHEDQDYICRHIMLKRRIGFVKEAQYNYYHYNDSLSYLRLNPLYSFTTLTDFEKLIKEYSDSNYLKALFLYNLEWRLLNDQLFPYGLKGRSFEKAITRLKSVIKKTDIQLILEHPFIDLYHRFFFLKFFNFPVTVLPDTNGLSLYFRDRLIIKKDTLEIVVSKINIRNGYFIMEAFIKEVAFNFCNAPKLFLVINNEVRKEISIFKSDAGRYRTHIMTNCFYGFYINEAIVEDIKFTFEIELNGTVYPVSYYFMPFCSISSIEKRVRFEKEGFITELKDNNTFCISQKNETICNNEERIWLYYDCRGVTKDNGLIQFLHDVSIDDGIKKFFIYNGKSEHLPDDIYSQYKEHIIPFGDIRHKHLLFNAEKIITAYIENKNIYPFDISTCRKYGDKLSAEIIYLQHGVLHASLPWKYAREESRFDKVVVSSQTEVDNYMYKYNIPSEKIICAGMPRFDYLDRRKKGKKRLLFAPSWRSYLIKDEKEGWIPMKDNFKKSTYYKKYTDFLKSEKLSEIIDRYNFHIDVKLHPIFNCYKDMFDINNKRIKIIDEVKNEEDYSLFLTDFSSFSFDYVWLQRPIIYFIPDREEFEAGLNYYRELDISFENGFGNYYYDSKDVICEIERIIKRNLIPDDKYLKRMKAFFLPIKKCTDTIYNVLIN